MNCRQCSAVLSERGSFCKACGAQVRCLHCKDLLEPDAAACVECGTLTGQGQGTANGTGPRLAAGPVAANRNTISFHEDRNSRTFTASLTDDAIGNIREPLAEFFVHRGVQPRTINRSPLQPEIVIEQQKSLPPGEADAPTAAPPGPAETDDKVRICKLFRENGQTLNLIDRRLKAKNGQDFTRRLTYLFLYAHELHGRYAILRTDVIAVLKEGKIWDSNASRWLNRKMGFKVDAEERLELLGEGRDDAKSYLKEALDPNVPDEWTPDKKGTAKRAPRKKKT